MSEEVEILGEALSPLIYLLPRTVKNYSVTPLHEFLDPPLPAEVCLLSCRGAREVVAPLDFWFH